MREVDRLMFNDFHIHLIQLMENAGRNLARLAQTWFYSNNKTHLENVFILAGSGGNGGGALVCARHLSNIGINVYVAITKPKSSFSQTAANQLDILEIMGITIINSLETSNYPAPDLIIDGVIGYSLHGNPYGSAADWINWANSTKSPVISLDVPSGLDSTNGQILNPAINAAATMTLALPKTGLFNKNCNHIVGELYLANISVPPMLYRMLSPPIDIGNLFELGDIIRIK
jgi:NAD(P)H-hydrate epimerase